MDIEEIPLDLEMIEEQFSANKLNKVEELPLTDTEIVEEIDLVDKLNEVEIIPLENLDSDGFML